MIRVDVMDTPTPGEVIAVYKNDDGTLRNVTIRQATALQTRLRTVPRQIDNPDFAPVASDIFAAADSVVAAEAAQAAQAAQPGATANG